MELAEYDRIAAAEDSHWWYRSTRGVLRTWMEPYLRAGQRILDVGCGPGGNGAWLAEHGTVVSLDIENLALDHVRTNHPSLVPVLGSATSIPVATASIDVVLAVTVLYHVGDDAAAFSEIARVLRPGGVAMLVEPAFNLLARSHDAHTHGQRRYRRSDLANGLTDHGVRLVRSSYAKSFLVPPAAMLAFKDRGLSLVKGAPSPREANDARSDLEAHAFDRVTTPLFTAMAAREGRWLARRSVAFGTSVLALGVRDR